MLAKDCPFARRIVNSGRLSVPSVLEHSPLNTPDVAGERFAGPMKLGAPCLDAPVRAAREDTWLLSALHRSMFTGIYFAAPGTQTSDCARQFEGLAARGIAVHVVVVLPAGASIEDVAQTEELTIVEDVDGVAGQRFDATPGAFYLLRPDQHLCARWRTFDAALVRAAVDRATCHV